MLSCWLNVSKAIFKLTHFKSSLIRMYRLPFCYWWQSQCCQVWLWKFWKLNKILFPNLGWVPRKRRQQYMAKENSSGRSESWMALHPLWLQLQWCSCEWSSRWEKPPSSILLWLFCKAFSHRRVVIHIGSGDTLQNWEMPMVHCLQTTGKN